MSAPKSRQLNLIVTGDIVVDHHLYAGTRDTPIADHNVGVRDHEEPGGAKIVEELLRQTHVELESLLEKERGDLEKTYERPFVVPALEWNVHLGRNETSGYRAYASWVPHKRVEKEKKKKPNQPDTVWRTKLRLGYQFPESEAPDEDFAPPVDLPGADILVFDDAGLAFRNHKKGWLLPKRRSAQPRWVVLKMSQPVARGELWHELVSRFADRLVCVVSADALRSEPASIACGLSWERSVEDVSNALLNSPTLSPLKRCRHLIVQFSADGALWLHRDSASRWKAKIVFDADGAEGVFHEEHTGGVFGMSATLTAAVAHGLALHIALKKGNDHLDLVPAIKSGLLAVRNLHELGHGPSKERPSGFPVDRIAKIIAAVKIGGDPKPQVAPNAPTKLKIGPKSQKGAEIKEDPKKEAKVKEDPESEFADMLVSWPRSVHIDRPWMLVEAFQRPTSMTTAPPLVGLAKQIVLRGRLALDRCPHATFGALTTIDRAEIEALRALRRLMMAYKEKRPKRPLSIGVFGPPGAGKSFGVKQIANEVFGEKAWLEFNLSQFDSPEDLVGAFHQVRDKVLSGLTPVVFWDEFDSSSLKWLQYLLAPMQDGRFQHGPLNHSIGKCVFVFAGGTSYSYHEFNPPKGAKEDVARHFTLSKGRDFHSRLDAYYDVVGPNQRTIPFKRRNNNLRRRVRDICVPLRRALLIRSQMECKDEDEVDFDSGLLDALLLIREYRHGARSLEKLVSDFPKEGRRVVRRSLLPGPAQLSMHVDEQAFNKLLKSADFHIDLDMIESLAAAIHQNYFKLSRRMGFAVAADFGKPYAKLEERDKEPNRAAAWRYPRILSFVGLAIARPHEVGRAPQPSRGEIEMLLKLHRERLAEEEHRGWMDERLAAGWRYGKVRDNKAKIHPLLVPYAGLEPEQKNKDRDAIDNIPAVVAKAGYRIVWLS